MSSPLSQFAPWASPFVGDELLGMVKGGTNWKVSLSQLSTFLGSGWGGAGQFVIADASNGVDDRAALQALINTGLPVALKPMDYIITSGLEHVAGSGFVCFGGKARIVAKTGVGGFNIKDTSAPRNGLDRNMLRCENTDGLVIHNVEFALDGVNQVVLHGIRVTQGMGTLGYSIRQVGFRNWSNGAMIAFTSVGAGRNRVVDIDYAVDGGISAGLATFPNGAQTTVFELDNDQVANTPSAPGVVHIGRIKNILYTGQALIDFQQQTDGINLIGHGAFSTTDWVFILDEVDGVGEPVDIQGWRTTTYIGSIKNAYYYGVKYIHGAQHNHAYVGVVHASGNAAVLFSGSSTAPTERDTLGNSVRIGTVINPGSYGNGLVTNGYVVLFGNAGSTYKPKSNTAYVDNVVGDGVNLDDVVSDGGADFGNDNLVIIGKASGFAGRSVHAPPGNVRVKYQGRCFCEMTMSATQNITTATATKLAFNTVQTDTESIAVIGSNKVTIKWPGTYRVIGSARLNGWAVGASDRWQMELRQDTTVRRTNSDKIDFSAGKDERAYVDEIIYIDEDDIGTVNADLSIWITQDTGATKTVDNALTFTRFVVQRID
jgi:hypothetical protein